jgi:autotransporter-associated beta strand protein
MTFEGSTTLSGNATNTYKGSTTLARGTLRLAKPEGRIAIPGNLVLGDGASESGEVRLVWEADGQVGPTTTITVEGTRPITLDLGKHKTKLAKLAISKSTIIQTAAGGELATLQLWVDGQRLADGAYQAPQPWLKGDGTVRISARVDVAGSYGDPDSKIGGGNIGAMTGDVQLVYPMSSTTVDFENHGHKLILDSGDGNGFAYLGSISGKGEVQFFMGPSYTGYRDAPMHFGGPRANTLQGTYRVRKGRVQLEKPEGVDAISAAVVVGGQGFNDCLFWKNSHQVNDGANITLLDAGNDGAAYLHLNGCEETAASLNLTARNRVVTDSATASATESKSGTTGKPGLLRVKSLRIDGQAQPSGTYTSATAKWIEGRGQVIVAP